MRRSNYISIAIGAFLIISALVYTEHSSVVFLKTLAGTEQVLRGVPDIQKDDHVRGGDFSDEEEQIYVIEYSDPTCFFCAWERPILKNLQNSNPDVKFVYRHFNPFNKSKAIQIAEAMECVANLGGEDVFWEYLEEVFENQSDVDDKFLNTLAIQKGINIEKFHECRESDDTLDKINRHDRQARKLGAIGTPYIIITKNNQIYKSVYALAEGEFQSLIDEARE